MPGFLGLPKLIPLIQKLTLLNIIFSVSIQGNQHSMLNLGKLRKRSLQPSFIESPVVSLSLTIDCEIKS
jgi:hypothetical protein